MGDALAANEVQTKRNRRQRRDGHMPADEPTSTPLYVGSSETESDDNVRAVTKRRKEAEVERAKAKMGSKSVKKLPVKKAKVTKKAHTKPNLVKGPSPSVQKPVEEYVLTRDERIAEMEREKVLNGRVFYLDILIEFGIKSIEGCKPSTEFTQQATKRGDIKRAGLPKKFLRGEYQLIVEFINKVLVPRSEKRTVASAADLFLIEQLDELEAINLPAIMLEYMHRMFSVVTLLECECVEGKVKGKSHVSDLLEQQASLKRELTDLTVTLNANSVDKEEVERLRDENAQLLKTNASLGEEVQALNKQIIQAHVDANERMTLLLKSFSSLPPPS
ncbi:hypothetical protein KY285_015950 [Solanum tuberosum]|nr:hypothetical protein KY285_015950 [Solanum tuberosum]